MDDETKEDIDTKEKTKKSKEETNKNGILKKIKKSAYYIAGGLAIGGMFLTVVLVIVGFLVIDAVEKPVSNQLDDISTLMEQGRTSLGTIDEQFTQLNTTITTVQSSLNTMYASSLSTSSAISGLGLGLENVPVLSAYGNELKNAGTDLSDTVQNIEKL